MSHAILLTGATGFLGTELVSCLVKEHTEKIYVLVRGENSEEVTGRLKAAWYPFPDIYTRNFLSPPNIRNDGTRPPRICISYSSIWIWIRR